MSKTTSQIQFRAPIELVSAFRGYAKENDVPKSDIGRTAIAEFLQSRGVNVGKVHTLPRFGRIEENMDRKIPMALNILGQQVAENNGTDISAELQQIHDLVANGKHNDALEKLAQLQAYLSKTAI